LLPLILKARFHSGLFSFWAPGFFSHHQLLIRDTRTIKHAKQLTVKENLQYIQLVKY